MKVSKINIKTDDDKEKQSPSEIIEFTNPVEISGDGEYLYITEIKTDPKSNLMKGLLR